MGRLTQNERDGLEDIFSSIQIEQNGYQKLKSLETLLLSTKSKYQLSKIIKLAKYGLARVEFSYFYTKTSKKKKNLSK